MKKPQHGQVQIPEILVPIRTGFLYLLLPFLIFSLGIIKPIISIPLSILLTWLAVRFWKTPSGESGFFYASRKDLLTGSIILLVWVFLSGIGGYAFQNSDFHIRNAVFRDMVAMDWPPLYSFMNGSAAKTYGFNYYIGYWLPSALAGKLFGWNAANFALFLWTFAGVHIASSLLMKKTGLNFAKSSLLLIFFSGMDILGTVFTKNYFGSTYPDIWPPIQHLEWWVHGVQFSSFTTQLFWVFNQAVPAWVALLLIINMPKKKILFLVLALCVFLCPIPALGLLPITIYYALQKGKPDQAESNQPSLKMWSVFTKSLLHEIKESITLENIAGGGLVLAVSLVYFYSSSGGVPRQISQIEFENIVFVLIFSLLEWLILWMALWQENKRNLLFYITGAFLLFAPIIRLTTTDVIAKRATIPFLLLLMVWCGQYLVKEKGWRRAYLILLLALGAMTPLYEINRSVYRTSLSYFHLQASLPAEASSFDQDSDKPAFPSIPEADHPETRIADRWYSLSGFKPEMMGNWIGPTESSLFYRFLARD